ncbi:MAG TPA: glycine cleavage system protein GcvH [Gammaproteobacteria bacterium]|nr:glycine cleavage system protein GcvH [Gammaproteobacteria bacterium]
MSILRYTDDHEWARLEGDSVTVGITEFAQDQLGELVFVELPTVGAVVTQGDEAAVIESVKAAGEVKSPVGGTIMEINESLVDTPEKVNDDPMGEGWIYKVAITDPTEWESLMDEAAYAALVADTS